MNLSNISEVFLSEENSVQERIYDAINCFENILFNAGAGSGKTYALIDSLKYILRCYSKSLNNNHQKVICITYTNVAVDEIKVRLGNPELVDVTTIHEKLWALIKSHRKELLAVHVRKIQKEIFDLDFMLNDSIGPQEPKYRAYQALSDEKKYLFCGYVLNVKDVFFKNYDNGSVGFRAAFGEGLSEFPNIIRNVSNFKKIVGTIYKLDNYKCCLKNIYNEHKDYKNVRYDSTYNADVLHKMIFSHDTLIDYSLEMIEKYPLLRQIIIDSYPYVLIDEYQDTNPKVIKIMRLLSSHSKELNHNFFIGYFGDKAQNIYDDGVGSRIDEYHPELKCIYKRFNRRSNSEIISVINKIRGDEIQQESIYTDCTGGSVKFYYCHKAENKLDAVSDFIDRYKEKWGVDNNNKLHCLVLTNRLVAELSGFSSIYSSFSESKYYKRNYKYINTELLSNDLGKLGVVPTIILKIVKLKVLLGKKIPLNELLSKDVYSSLIFSDLISLLGELRSITGGNLNEYVASMLSIYQNSSDNFKRVVHEIVDLDELSYEVFFGFVLDNLNPQLDYDDQELFEEAKEKLNALLNVDIDEYVCWYNFINDKQDSDVIYHTYHGTKGVEFKNVIILMENNFGRMNPRKFSNFFSHILNADSLDDSLKIKHENTKNLLYVSCSRAINNLRVLYMDDISSFSDGIRHVFDDITLFK